MKNKIVKTTSDTSNSIGLLILRIGIGSMMLTHGFPKLMKLIEGNMNFSDPLGIGSGASLALAVFAEFFCSILLIFGIYTRLVAIPLIIAMATAAFIAHGDDPFSTKEKALLFLTAYITLLFTGAGKYSVDKKLE